VSFIVATVVSEWSDVKIRVAARTITENAAPSIVHLEALRSEARRLIVLTDDYVDESVNRAARENHGRRPVAAGVSPPRTTTARDAINASRVRLDAEWHSYRALPTFPGELLLSAPVAQLKDRLSGDVDGALQALDARDPTGAVDALERAKPDADALEQGIVRLVDLNARNARHLASRIDGLGRRSIMVAMLLDGISVLLTIFTALLVLRVLRRYSRLVEHRAEEMELFAGRVAHDILSPLGAASLALSHVARIVGDDDARAQRILALGQRGIDHTRLIADDLLKFASAAARPDPQARADVRAVVTAVVDEVRPMADDRHVALSIERLEAGAVACSPGILTSLVSNLVRNGVKYVGEGPAPRVVVRARCHGIMTTVEVEDNGPGLPAAPGFDVFEPYVRGPDNREPGIGLGLATVKRVVEAHGGTVCVRSSPGVGCRFIFTLPSAPPAAADDDGAARENALRPAENAPRVESENDLNRGHFRKDSDPPGRAC
jgi:signal transduction histidine kinase